MEKSIDTNKNYSMVNPSHMFLQTIATQVKNQYEINQQNFQPPAILIVTSTFDLSLLII